MNSICSQPEYNFLNICPEYCYPNILNYVPDNDFLYKFATHWNHHIYIYIIYLKPQTTLTSRVHLGVWGETVSLHCVHLIPKLVNYAWTECNKRMIPRLRKLNQTWMFIHLPEPKELQKLYLKTLLILSMLWRKFQKVDRNW